jgi:hypothetical protein
MKENARLDYEPIQYHEETDALMERQEPVQDGWYESNRADPAHSEIDWSPPRVPADGGGRYSKARRKA